MKALALVHGAALAEVLGEAAEEGTHRIEKRRQWLWLLLPVAAVAGLVAAWSANAPLAGAVVAPAQLTVETKRKTVQHQEGGIVREMLVRDGQAVHAGDALMVVADLRQEAELTVLQDQWRASSLRAARADAESRLAAAFNVPASWREDTAAAGHVALERTVFATHRHALDEQTALLHAQARQAQAQADSLASQLASTAVSRQLSQEELQINEGLAAQGFVNRSRLITLRRTAADYQSRIGEVGGDT